MEKQIFKLHWSKCMFIYTFRWFDYHVCTQLSMTLQYNTALTNQEHNFVCILHEDFFRDPKGNVTASKLQEKLTPGCVPCSVPRSSNPALFTLQFTFCLCTCVSLQAGSAKGEGEGWCTPESCSDLQPAHNWTWKGHQDYISLKEFGIPNAM